MFTLETFRQFVQNAGPRQYATKIRRNSQALAWVMEQSASLPEHTSIPHRVTFILEGELLINLLDWCKQNEVTYSQGYKMVERGELRSKQVGGRVKVPADAKPVYERIRCEVCGKMLAFITGTHLQQHGMTIHDYRTQYPHAPIIAETRGQKRTPEQRETYRQARSKWMSENPLRTKDTAGERSVAAWLDQHAIRYIKQWQLPIDERGKHGHHPHDFFLPDYNTIIEFDGSHHWAYYWCHNGGTPEQIVALLEAQIVKDAEQNWQAGQAGYRIVRVRGYGDVDDSEWGTLEYQLALQGFAQ